MPPRRSADVLHNLLGRLLRLRGFRRHSGSFVLQTRPELSLTIKPNSGTQVLMPTLWIMAVGQASAVRAGALGLPLALSAFHRPEEAQVSASAYRKAFRPSSRPGLPPTPKLFVALRVTSAPSHSEAERLAMPMRWAFEQRRRFNVMPQCLPGVEEAIELAGGVWPAESNDWPMYTVSALTDLRSRLMRMGEACGADEIMMQDVIPDPKRRLEHYHDVARCFA
ncbi:LLM class flavin-dependent oxidoreductase [Devosia sp.]|uniref:LLM class flavin-dependent oxidoreductase n=1 Tax=Devosia sp. TaxID=1871048 RepID=UPI003457DB10